MKRRLLQLRGWLPAVYHNVEVTARRRAHISQRACRLLTFPTFLRSPFATKSAIREMKVAEARQDLHASRASRCLLSSLQFAYFTGNSVTGEQS